MKRRIAASLAIAAGIAPPQSVAVVDASMLIDDYHLRVRPEMEDELRNLNRGEFAPLEPNTHTRFLVEQQQHRRQQQYGQHHGERRVVKSCSSPLVTWSTEQIREMGYDTYKTLYDNKIIQMSYVYKHYIDRNEYEEFFVSVDQTRELQRRHRDTISFWKKADIDGSILDTDDILLLSMHGTVLSDNDKLVPTIMRIFDFDSTSEVLKFASKVQNIVTNLPGGYNNPLLTMNAVATRSTYNHGTFNGHDDSSRRVKDSIIIGDGVLKFLYDSGLETSGPDFVHAHEFGHHLQFRLDMTVPPNSAYVHDDRRKELMADAISGYFLAHDDGANMFAEEIGIFDKTAFATGDCSTESSDHHGTPLQRQCAAIWGASLASPENVPMLDPELFVGSFNEAYLRMLDLDEGVCTLVLEDTSIDIPVLGNNEEGRLPSVQGIQVGNWDNSNGGYNENEKINLNDWLDAVEDKDPKDQGWEDPFESKYEWSDNNEQPSSNHDSVYVPDQEVVSLVPLDNYSWESRGKPSSANKYDEGSTPGLRPNTSSSSGSEVEERVNPYGNFADRGTTPEETKHSYMNHEMRVVDCRMPWVYCQTSSSSLSLQRVHYFGSVLLAIGLPMVIIL